MRKMLLLLILALSAQHTTAQETAAPAFTLASADGEQVTLPRSHDGADIYFFWASWCPYCKALMPHLQSMLIEYGDDLTIYALNIRDDEDPVAFMDDRGYEFTVIPAADSIMELYGVRSTPGLFVVDGQGMIHLNLYKMIFADKSANRDLSNSQKAGLRAPYWAAGIRQKIDQVLLSSP